METHEHHQMTNTEPWIERHRWITYLALGILAYFLIVEHGEHILPYLPYLILAACPLMHFFMHGKHGQGHSHHNQQENKQ